MHEKNSQFILLKIPPHLVRLLGKIHALFLSFRKTILNVANLHLNEKIQPESKIYKTTSPLKQPPVSW